MMHNSVVIRQRITNALEEVISEHGTSGVSVSVIAQKVQVSKALIYREFGGVQGLLAYYVQVSSQFPHFTLDYLEQFFPGRQEDAHRI